MPAELHAFTNELRKLVSVSVKKCKHISQKVSSQLYLFRCTRSLLHNMHLCLLATDKDGGYAAIPLELLRTAYEDVVCNGDYSFGSPDTLQLGKSYRNLCEAWEKHYDLEGLGRKLLSSLRSQHCSFTSKLSLNAKTHKQIIEFRNLHLSSNWSFGALSRFVGNVLQELLNSKPFILKNSKHLVKALSEVEYFPDAKFARIDVKHFFMSGTCTELTDLAASPFTALPIHALLSRSIYFLLNAQYVVVPTNGGKLKVVKGSGMGLPHSSGTSETAFYAGAEARMIPLLKSHNMLFYGRFKDDILIIYRDFSKFKSFMDQLKVGHPFTLQCEEISSHEVNFLEVTIRKSNNSYVVTPYTKPTVLAVPWLSRHSFHHPSIHAMWPIARYRDRQQLCSSLESKLFESRRFLTAAKQQHLAARAIAEIEKLKVGCAGAHKSRNPASSSGSTTFWLVLPFCPVIHASGLAQRITRFSSVSWVQSALYQLFGIVINIRVAWRNIVPTSSIYLKPKVMQEADKGRKEGCGFH